ncbi:MAG TPA: polysaccharide deacetylase family protein, partial [Syntrophobacteraceae bacterium]|nr:polysaccharide deacetylase family protein [Syntrophobacteraceae bacterium]
LFFITTGFIDLDNDDDRRAFMSQKLFRAGAASIREGIRNMSWDDVSRLAEQGHEIGSHTRNHASLIKVSSKALLEAEIIGSAYDIEKRSGLKVRSFAYPFGDIASINSDVLMTAKAQYDFVFSGVRGFNTSHTHPLAIRRDSVGFDYPPAYNNAVSYGLLSHLYTKDRARLDIMAEGACNGSPQKHGPNWRDPAQQRPRGRRER